MRQIFADTFYWIALINPSDQWYKKVFQVSQSLVNSQIVTTEEVLSELLTFYSKAGFKARQRSSQLVTGIIDNLEILVMPQTHQSFLAGFALYSNRLDKGYSLTDCISMNTMRQMKIQEVLTHDLHFTQEGFIILFP